MMKYFISIFALLLALGSTACQATKPDGLTKELCASGRNRLIKVALNELNEEGDYLFFFDRKTGVKYGETISTNAPFLSTGGQYFFAKNIDFMRVDGSGSTKFGDDDLPVRLATLYRYKNQSATMICLTSQFGGLGQSGSFQKTQWSIVFPANAREISQFKGFFGK